MKLALRALIFSLLLLLPLIDSYGIVIRLYPEAKVSGLRVELGGIADIEGDDESIIRKLKKISLMPMPYQTKIITTQEIQRRLAYHIQEDLIFIGEKTTIQPVFTKILETEILEKIRSALLKKFPGLTYDKMDVSLLDTIQSIKIPYGEIEIRPIIAEKSQISNLRMIRTDIFVDNTLYSSRSFRIKLTIKKN